MQVLYERCCGLDVHKQTVVACLFTPGPDGTRRKEIRTFGTMTADLQGLADWLAAAGCTHVAMESTGVYWKPVFNILEGRFTTILANAQHIKAVPGRKTDVLDCEWIAELLQHGLLRPSFIPPAEVRAVRELTRYRKSLIQERAAEVNRVQKILETANIKLGDVASDVMGKSGRAMLAAIVAGQSDAVVLADLAQGRLRQKRDQLLRALEGRVGPQHRLLLAEQLAHIDYLDEAIARLDDEIAQRVRPHQDQLDRLDTIPGVDRRTAEVMLAEMGFDVKQAFPDVQHLASWATVCPGNNQSADKRRSGRTRRSKSPLKVALTEAAWAAGRTKNTYLSAQYHRLAARRGKKKAIVAVAHSILVIAYHLLTEGTTYTDLGANYFDDRDREAVQRRLIKRLEKLGLKVSVEPVDVKTPATVSAT